LHIGIAKSGHPAWQTREPLAVLPSVTTWTGAVIPIRGCVGDGVPVGCVLPWDFCSLGYHGHVEIGRCFYRGQFLIRIAGLKTSARDAMIAPVRRFCDG